MIALVFLFGLLLGSFYNVVSMRTLKGGNLSYPPSNCVHCNHRLSPLDLVPVMSYSFLRGKCRYCKEKISPIYPFTELLTATSYALIVYQFGLTMETAIQLTLITILILSTVTDLKEMIVPDRFIVIGLILVLTLRIIDGDIVSYLIAGAIAFSGMLLIMIVNKMGGADVKLYALIGLSIGLMDSVGSLFYAAIIATLFYMFMLIIKKREVTRKLEIPFVPFITLGVLCTYFLEFFRF